MSSVRRMLLASALVLTIPSFAGRAHADAYEAAIARAIAAKETALTSNDPADWLEAEHRFEEADQVRSTPETKYEIAVAASHLKQEDVAVESFEAAIAGGLEGAPRDKARAYVDEHLPKLARLRVDGPKGAEVWVAGRRRGVLPLARSIVIFPGASAVRVVDGSSTIERSVSAKEGEEVSLDVNAPKPPPTPPVSPPIVVPPPKVTDDTKPSRTLDLGLVIGGGALVALGGVGFFVANATIADARDSLATNCVPKYFDGSTCGQARAGRQPDAQADADTMVTWQGLRIASVVSVGVGLASIAWGTVRLVSTDKSSARSTWSLAVGPRIGGGFVALEGAF